MPSRTGMIFMGSRGRGRGDPFFGALARLAVRGVGALIKRTRGIKIPSLPSGARGAGTLMRSPATGKLVRVARAAAGAVGLGAGFEIGTRLLGPGEGLANGEVRKRRGINPLNPKAARRAVSRLCRLQHFTDRLEHSLSDLVKKKHHHHGHHRR